MRGLAKLSIEQESKIPEWVEKWIGIGLSTEPADFDKAIAAALRAYSLCGLVKPLLILKVSSPYSAVLADNLAYKALRKVTSTKMKRGPKTEVDNPGEGTIKDQIRSQIGSLVKSDISSMDRYQITSQVRDQVWSNIWGHIYNQIWDNPYDTKVEDSAHGQVWRRIKNPVHSQIWDKVGGHINNQINRYVTRQIQGSSMRVTTEGSSASWIAYMAYHTFFRDVCGLDLGPGTSEKSNIILDLIDSCGGVWWQENLLIVSDRPRKISLDAEGRLHCENGPSIEYSDGLSLHNWHGVSIPEEWVTTKKPTAKEALTWENIEQRRAACEIIGWANVIRELDATTVDEDNDPEIGTLLECNIPNSGNEKFLRVLCGTSREFVIPVPREMKTAIEANSWTWGLSPNEYKPEVRT